LRVSFYALSFLLPLLGVLFGVLLLIGVVAPSSSASGISSVSPSLFLLNCLFVFLGEKFFLFFFSVGGAARDGIGFLVGL
tara:strand:- start:441 stop:680 length:240 start_codon:yes stop_codon:yes gene_type:complete